MIRVRGFFESECLIMLRRHPSNTVTGLSNFVAACQRYMLCTYFSWQIASVLGNPMGHTYQHPSRTPTKLRLFFKCYYCESGAAKSRGLIQLHSNLNIVAIISQVYKFCKLQTASWLEPAGSHGVWGLDGCHFLTFIFGSAQLVHPKYIKPKSLHNTDILENFSHEYLYLECVQFMEKVCWQDTLQR